MIGVYDYTVILTYLSAVSASLGVIISLSGQGHPFIGIFFLLACGLFDAFDGRVARKKKNRTDFEKKFGIQIDSLSDLIAFGVLPACIGVAMLWHTSALSSLLSNSPAFQKVLLHILFYGVLVLYALTALIRLAYFNVTEEERQSTENPKKMSYTGLPVTSSAIIFPSIVLLQYITDINLTIPYFIVAAIMAVMFVSKFRLPKPGFKAIMVMVSIGFIEFISLLIFNVFK